MQRCVVEETQVVLLDARHKHLNFYVITLPTLKTRLYFALISFMENDICSRGHYINSLI